MMFMIHFEIDPDHREKSTERLRTGGPGLPENVTPVGIWHSVTLLEGWAIVETDDANALAKHMDYWTDLNINHITPVLPRKRCSQFLRESEGGARNAPETLLGASRNIRPAAPVKASLGVTAA